MCAWSAFSLEASRLYVRSVSTGGDADNAEDDQACAICIFCGMTNEMSRTGDLNTDAISFYKRQCVCPNCLMNARYLASLVNRPSVSDCQVHAVMPNDVHVMYTCN